MNFIVEYMMCLVRAGMMCANHNSLPGDMCRSSNHLRHWIEYYDLHICVDESPGHTSKHLLELSAQNCSLLLFRRVSKHTKVLSHGKQQGNALLKAPRLNYHALFFAKVLSYWQVRLI
jgi:hypothetical protein